jgi:hypothetical protein
MKKETNNVSSIENGKRVKTELDLEMFKKQLPCSVIKVPNSLIGKYQMKLKKQLLVIPKFK